MLTLSSYIKITDPSGSNYLEFDFVNEVVIEKSRKTLTNTASITLARKLKVLNGDINQILKRKSKIEISLGYDGNLIKEFTGYISNVGAKIPLVISCQDEMWNLKQNSFTKAWKKVKVADVVKYVYPGATQIIDLEIGGFVIKKQSTAQVLEGLKKFGLQCYFDQDVLVVDFGGSMRVKRKEVIYDFYQNIIENNLEYKVKDDSRIKVIATSKLHTGKKLEITLGDPDGDVHTLHYVNLDKSQLEKIATAEIETLKYEGYKGDYTTFGLPYIEPGDVGIMIDPEYPEHQGSYLVEAVKTTFSTNGFRRSVVPERKVA
ncbi:hypothetical protein [Mucilaginibacter sp. 5C4]|uniref:hypothetical protein n=1 Tax=Mucilaginibacter sp. 5C4 TaxID=3048589 RepID=UPI002AC8D572|nr:hypothetical protein [Mucilaginibacter sp. 5C4]MEB0302397.1 hypothetical protein [Mucilaginibacter sp. 5C4]WPX22963.1 hypothetical protein RHM67_16910 [Mucilaginibacter sp. 5C4]